MYDGTLKFDTAMDTSGFQRDANNLSSIVKGLGVFSLLKKGMDAVVGSLDSAITRYDTLKQYPKMLEQMGFSSEEAAESTQKLSDGIAGLPTTLDSVVSTSQRLTILTGNLERSTDLTIALNNAFLASGASSGDASRGLEQYVQMLSAGKVDMQSWKTLQETMGLGLNKTAEAFGFAGESAQNDLYAALQSGEITFNQFSDKLLELNEGVDGFAELAKTSTSGIGTAWTNLKSAITRGTANIITAIDSGLSRTRFKSIENIISSATKVINQCFAGIVPVFEFLASKAEILVPLLIAVGAAVAAWKVGAILTAVATSFQTAALQVGLYKASVGGAITADALQTAGLTAKEIIVGILTGQISLATAAQYIWNAAMSANPIGLVIAGAAALVVGIVALVKHLSLGSKAYQAHKEEVKALAEAQEDLAEATQESADTFEETSEGLEATATVASNYVDNLTSVANCTMDAAEKAKHMKSYCDQLNAAVDGLNITYDEETGAIRNINTGQEISLEQLEELVDAKSELAKTEAWTKRQSELISEQVQIQEGLIAVERKRKEIQEDSNLSDREREKLLNDLQESESAYATQMEDVSLRLDIVNENIAASSSESAQQVVSDYELMESAVTKNGENIEQVAEKWGTSTDTILEALKEQGITLDEWVSQQEEAQAESEAAWQDYEDAVKDKTDNVVNSFKRLPDEFDMSAQEMLKNLQSNKERYAEWEYNMAEITRLLGPTAAEEFSKLGPEANSAVEEILNSTELLDEYREVFGVKIDETTGQVIEDFQDPDFIGAPRDAIYESIDEAEKTEVDMEAAGTAIGTHFTDGLCAGIKAGIPRVQYYATESAGILPNTHRSVMQIRSPSRVMIDIFKNAMRGAAIGMESMEDVVYGTADTIAAGITDHLTVPPELAANTTSTLLGLSDTALRSTISVVSTAPGWNSTSNNGPLLQKAVDLLGHYLPEVANMQISMDGREVGRTVSPYVNECLAL